MKLIAETSVIWITVVNNVFLRSRTHHVEIEKQEILMKIVNKKHVFEILVNNLKSDYRGNL